MNSNLKLPSRNSSSSSGSLKIINFNDFDNAFQDPEKKKDLFDILLEDGPLGFNTLPSLSIPKI